MDDSFQFIIESPQHSTGHKKRPRLVTSCDNCRLKKIKCLQPAPETKCEACKAAKIPCRFRDRERYFAERSRAIAGPSASSNYSNGQRSDGSVEAYAVSYIFTVPSFRPDFWNCDRPAELCLQMKALDINLTQQTNDDPQSIIGNACSPKIEGTPGSFSGYCRTASPPQGYSNSRSSAAGYGSMSPSPAPVMQHTRSQSSSQTRTMQLFNQDFPHFPNHAYMEAFMPIFFQHYQQEFPFIIYDDVIADYVDRRSAPIINTIAAMAVGHCNIPELTGRNLSTVIQAYGDNARAQLNSATHVSSEDNLRACMLFAWFEYKQQRVSGFRDYAHLALRMCQMLGYTAPNGALLSLQDTERRRQTSKGLFSLNYTLTHLR
ncbi:hypothetical protein AAF712_000523 [Marasmius tenuissimus]|uniref:Zn(2)-C6 fungal-type domain-containing protein n=1 Tax=Marasmius tenuissimus TaxID=585030 RepID=A0ABR3AH18_9AGAR